MNKTLFLALLALGIVLLVLGLAASDSVSSSISRLFTGQPTDKTVWLLVGGGLALLVGAGGLMRSTK